MQRHDGTIGYDSEAVITRLGAQLAERTIAVSKAESALELLLSRYRALEKERDELRRAADGAIDDGDEIAIDGALSQP